MDGEGVRAGGRPDDGQGAEAAAGRAGRDAPGEAAAAAGVPAGFGELVAVGTIARQLDVSRKSVLRAIAARHLEAYRFGRSVRVTRRSLEEYIAARRVLVVDGRMVTAAAKDGERPPARRKRPGSGSTSGQA